MRSLGWTGGGWWYPGSLLDTSRDTGECWCECWWNNWNNDFWVMLPIFLVTSLLEGKERGCAPRKIKMEPENTPLEEESHLNQTNQGFNFLYLFHTGTIWSTHFTTKRFSRRPTFVHSPKKPSWNMHFMQVCGRWVAIFHDRNYPEI